MRFTDQIEARGVARWGAKYTERATYGDDIADQYGRAQIWKRITWAFYIVALAMMIAPIGNTLHYVGWMISTVGLFPLVCWLGERFKFRKAVKVATEAMAS
jgi:lipopolysaccharide export LptBFGC system permease protein LptF